MRTILILVLVCTLGLAGCVQGDPPGNPLKPGDIPGMIVVGFYPLAWAAGQIADGRFEVVDLTPPGVEPHDLELTTEQVDAILDAELVLYLGGFQPALDDVLAMRDGVSRDLMLDVTNPDDRLDPHVWLDPVLMQRVLAAIDHALSRLDPVQADRYGATERSATAAVQAVNRAYEETLDDCERDLIVTAHDAFGRLAARFGLRVESIAGISPEAEPNPARLDELARLVEREGVTTIFTEEFVSPEVAETLARETGVKTAVLSPIESLTDEQRAAGEDYLSLMETNLDVLAEALGCR